jgi:N,N-dimethylformamidase
MVLVPYPNGGAVFSASSIAWSGCLSHNGYDNAVSRVMRNLLDRFADPAPWDRGRDHSVEPARRTS